MALAKTPATTAKPFIIGITGGIAMGKSTVERILKTWGYEVLDADQLARDLTGEHGAATAEILTHFPEAARSPDKTSQAGKIIDRKKLASIVFQDKKKLTKLESILHPKITALRQNYYDRMAAMGVKVVFIIVPLLFEKQIDKECDVTITLTLLPEKQQQRAMARVGMTATILQGLMANQLTDTERQDQADYVLANDGTESELQHNLKQLLAKILDGILDTINSKNPVA